MEIAAQLPKLCPFQDGAAGHRAGRKQSHARGASSQGPELSPAQSSQLPPSEQHLLQRLLTPIILGLWNSLPTPVQGSPPGGTQYACYMTGSINHPPQAASALFSVLCTHLSIFTQQAFSTDVLNQWIKCVCFPKQNSALQARLSLAEQSRMPRVTRGVTKECDNRIQQILQTHRNKMCWLPRKAPSARTFDSSKEEN